MLACHQQAYPVQRDQAVAQCSFYAYGCTGTGRRNVMPSHAHVNRLHLVTAFRATGRAGQQGATRRLMLLTLSSATAALQAPPTLRDDRRALHHAQPRALAACPGAGGIERVRPAALPPPWRWGPGQLPQLRPAVPARPACAHPGRLQLLLSGPVRAPPWLFTTGVYHTCKTLLSACPPHCAGCHA